MKKLHFTFLLAFLFLNSSYSQIVLDSGLVAHYCLNGNALDYSKYHNNGTVMGPVLTSDRFGNPNSAYYFDGIDDVIKITNYTNMSPVEEVTVSAWIKTDTAPGIHYTAIYDRLETNDGFGLVIRPNGILAFSINGGLCMTTSIGTVLDNEWHHVVGTYSKSDGILQAYIDCNLDGDTTYSSFIFYNPEPRNSIGGPGGATPTFFKGSIDDVRIYNRALNLYEIQSLCASIPVGIATINDHDIQIYPNPATDIVTIEWDGFDIASPQIRLFDSMGNLVYHNFKTSEGILQINIEDFQNGIYFIHFITASGSWSKKVLFF